MCLKYKNIFENLNIWEQNVFVKRFLTVIFTHNYIKAKISATMHFFQTSVTKFGARYFP
jgi:hypothetical protein